MASYRKTQTKIIESLSTDIKQGLGNSEAKQRLDKYGLNQLDKEKNTTLIVKFFNQLKDTMILILIAAAILSFVVAIQSKESLFEPILIVVIILINAIIGLVQEGKAERALESLQDLTPPYSRVLRDGEERKIPASEIVPGDIIILEVGDSIPADARLVEANSLKVDESMLTGESEPVTKDKTKTYDKVTAIGDRLNMVFSGSHVSYGSATAVVTDTGMRTELGTIAGLLNKEVNVQTPLQKKLVKLGVFISYLAGIACVAVFIIAIVSGSDILNALMLAVALAVSAIPEGLPAIVTVILAIGVQRMVKRNAVIRKLPAVETLGSASVICTDKTGTLTQNKMTLTQIYTAIDDRTLEIGSDLSDDAKLILEYGTLCSSSSINVSDEKVEHIGDPTETAIIYAAHQAGISLSELQKQYPQVEKFPFDSNRKRMSTVHEHDGERYVIVKGAYDSILPLCYDYTLNNSASVLETMSKDALRVLAVAYKKLPKESEELTLNSTESDLILLGLIGMIDPPREEAKQAVKDCISAGIIPVMITGDHLITASAIAKQVYILDDDKHIAITGEDLDAMSDDELKSKIEKIRVYARVSPENKIRIVKQWQSLGHVVAMTGDGVNDAPALKAADIGCAMGITGTDAAKGASDMVLTDDNFATIVSAAREGRGVYANIRKVVGLLLGTNLGEVISVLIAMLLWQQSPFIAIHLLFINLVTDSLPAIALGAEPVEDEVMSQKPKAKTEGLFSGGLALQIILMGIYFGLITTTAYYIGWQFFGGHQAGQTMAFGTLAMSQVIHSFNLRSPKSITKINPFSNPSHLLASVISLLAIVAVLLIPQVATVFSLASLTSEAYTIIGLLAISPIFIMEIYKGLALRNR